MSRTSLCVWCAFRCSLVLNETILKLSNSYKREHMYVDTLRTVHSVGFLVERLIYMWTVCLKLSFADASINGNALTRFHQQVHFDIAAAND